MWNGVSWNRHRVVAECWLLSPGAGVNLTTPKYNDLCLSNSSTPSGKKGQLSPAVAYPRPTSPHANIDDRKWQQCFGLGFATPTQQAALGGAGGGSGGREGWLVSHDRLSAMTSSQTTPAGRCAHLSWPPEHPCPSGQHRPWGRVPSVTSPQVIRGGWSKWI